MTMLQKGIKYLAIVFASFLAVSIIGGALSAIGLLGGFFMDEDLTGEMKTYSVTSDVNSLNIQVNAADLYIKAGDAFSVESNLKNLDVSERNGCLLVKDLKKVAFSASSSSEIAVLTIYIPERIALDSIHLTTGAGRVTADNLSAQAIDFELGAGDVSIGTLVAARSSDIEGGAGRITVSGGMLRDLDLDMGVGQLNLTSALAGDCQLDLGVGETNITLLGSKDEYRLEIEKGIGNISVDGKSVFDYGSSGYGANEVEINGGIGSINVAFKAAKENE